MKTRDRITRRENDCCLVASSNPEVDKVAHVSRREYANSVKKFARINGNLVPITPKQCEAYQKWFPQVELI